MKWLIGLVVIFVLGVAGVVVTHEMNNSSSGSQKIETISTGERVDLASHMRGGTWTVVEFTADW